jgi:hypothetical protein
MIAWMQTKAGSQNNLAPALASELTDDDLVAIPAGAKG